MWRLERVAGPETALEQLDDVYDDPVQCTECIGTRNCKTDWTYEVIGSDPGARTVYSYRSEAGDCHSIPRLAIDHVGRGVLVETERRGSRCEWRLLLVATPASTACRGDEIRAPGGTHRRFRQLVPLDWVDEAVTLAELPPEQQAAVEAAVEHGYYETPRDTSLTTSQRRSTCHGRRSSTASSARRRGSSGRSSRGRSDQFRPTKMSPRVDASVTVARACSRQYRVWHQNRTALHYLYTAASQFRTR